MIGTAFGLKELVFSNLSFGIKLPDPLLFLIGKPRGHRSTRDKKHRQMAEAKRTDQQARDNLVANPEQCRGIEHSVAERDRRSKRDDVAAEQRQIHPGLTLGHAIAHCRNAARDLRGRAHFASEDLHLVGISAIRLMRREHVIISSDNADIGASKMADRLLVLARGGKAVGEIAAAETGAADPLLLLVGDEFEVASAGRLGSLDDPVGNGCNGGMKRHGADALTRAS